jgi:hypothetical protein
MPEPISARPVPKLRAKSAAKPGVGRPRPKTIHVDQDADVNAALSSSRGPRGSTSNISGKDAVIMVAIACIIPAIYISKFCIRSCTRFYFAPSQEWQDPIPAIRSTMITEQVVLVWPPWEADATRRPGLILPDLVVDLQSTLVEMIIQVFIHFSFARLLFEFVFKFVLLCEMS